MKVIEVVAIVDGGGVEQFMENKLGKGRVLEKRWREKFGISYVLSI